MSTLWLLAAPVAAPGELPAVVAKPGVDGSSAVPFGLVQPTRRAPDAPPGAPPALPPGADRISPLTLDVVVRRQPAGAPAQVVRRTISRTADRVHLTAQDGPEWLFERNARDPRRVSGFRVDHAAGVIVVYDESDLRNAQGIRGWADILMLGLDRELLGSLHTTRKTRKVGEIRFRRYVAARVDGPREVWWNDDQVLPGGFVSVAASGSLRLSVERVRTGTHAAVLQRPTSRFPEYRAVDYADWLERH